MCSPPGTTREPTSNLFTDAKSLVGIFNVCNNLYNTKMENLKFPQEIRKSMHEFFGSSEEANTVLVMSFVYSFNSRIFNFNSHAD